MPPPSLARDFFERIVNAPDAVAAIRGLINAANPTLETDWLDFKTEHIDPKQRDKKISELWSEALGGFANNQGGVLIWGIDARKAKVREVEIDFACAEKPITEPLALRSRLTELQRGATDPPLANVEIRAYELPDSPGKGFVVCYIPEGSFKPYRSEQDDRQYYLRAGDNFVVMSRSVLAAMFHPRSQAMFKAKATLSWTLVNSERVKGPQLARFSCAVELVNDGTASARDVLVVVKSKIESQLPPGRPPEWLSNLWGVVAVGIPNSFEFQAHRPMHPHRVTPLAVLRWDVGAQDSPHLHQRVLPFCAAPSFELSVFCENQDQQVIRIEFDTAEMKQMPGGCYSEAAAS